MSDAKRTPGPWKLDGLTIRVPNRGVIARCPTPLTEGVFDCSANAAFIVIACNSHDELVEALKGLLLSADCSLEESGSGHDWREACKKARAALIKAGE